ncbi:hypothetical protein LRB31_04980 [Borreliella burgdorferi]|nr:hypothetical protein [Borreliella burgdorferi]
MKLEKELYELILGK